MNTTLRYRLFGIGKLPDALRATAETEGILHLFEGVPVRLKFVGRVPGLVGLGTDIRTYSGAVVFTGKRILASLSGTSKYGNKALDVPWDTGTDGPLTLTINEQGIFLYLDVAKVNPEWSGELSFHYRLSLSQEELAALPKRALALTVPSEYVLKAVGVRKRENK